MLNKQTTKYIIDLNTFQNVSINPSFEIIKGDIISNNEKELLPFKFALYQNYPNPFNPITTIDYEVARDGLVSIFVYDLMGRRIKTLVNKVNVPGRYSVNWNGTNDDSKLLSTGMYFYKMRAKGFESVKKLMLIK